MSAEEQHSEEEVTSALSAALDGKPPLRRGVLRALLKGRRVQVDDAALDAVLVTGPFVEVERGRWTLSPRGHDVVVVAHPEVRRPESPTLEVDQAELGSILDMTAPLLERVVARLAATDESVDWR